MSLSLGLWIAVTMAAFLAGSTALRSHVGTGALATLLLALALYTVGNLMMVRLMRVGGMAAAVSLSAVLQLVLANLIAVVAFGERPSGAQLAGIVLGLAAIVLILWPQDGP